MGPPLSLIMANLYMEKFERKPHNTYHLKPKSWKIFIDDTNVIQPHGKEELAKFLHHLNNSSVDIQFTIKDVKKGFIPFLGIIIIKKPNGNLDYKVYQKNTHTKIYLHGNSHHHPSQNIGVIKMLASRDFKISVIDHRVDGK